MEERKRRKLPEIFGIDTEYSKAIDSPMSAPSIGDTSPSRNPKQITVGQEGTQAEQQSKNVLTDDARRIENGQDIEQEINDDPAKDISDAERSGNGVVRVRPHVRPLARQDKEIRELEEMGFTRDVIMKLARKNTQQGLTVIREYKPAEKSAVYKGKEIKLSIPVAKADLDALSEQAGDFGTLRSTELVRSQVEPVWIKELDAIITKLKGKRL